MKDELRPAEAIRIMAEHDCVMTLQGLYAWIRSTNSPCPFGVYTQRDEDHKRGKYTVFRGRLMMWLEGRDMRVAYGGNYVDPEAAAVRRDIKDAAS